MCRARGRGPRTQSTTIVRLLKTHFLYGSLIVKSRQNRIDLVTRPDLDQDGKLTLQEFAIANFLINSVQDSEGGSSQDLPDELPSDLLPPKPMGPNQTDSD